MGKKKQETDESEKVEAQAAKTKRVQVAMLHYRRGHHLRYCASRTGGIAFTDPGTGEQVIMRPGTVGDVPTSIIESYPDKFVEPGSEVDGARCDGVSDEQEAAPETTNEASE